jgi:CRP/FNR family transcriptional regulator
MSSQLQAFERIPLWVNLAPAERRLIYSMVREEHYRVRTTVLKEAMPFSGLHIIKSGNIKLCKVCGTKEQILDLLGPGDVLDPIPLFDNGAHAVTAKTMTATTVYRFAPPEAQQLIGQYPSVLNALLSLVSVRLRKLAALANDLAFKDVSARICQVLLTQAAGGSSPTVQPLLERPLTRQELAAMVGTAREVAWRTLKQLERDGLIEIHGQNIVILDAAALASRA